MGKPINIIEYVLGNIGGRRLGSSSRQIKNLDSSQRDNFISSFIPRYGVLIHPRDHNLRDRLS